MNISNPGFHCKDKECDFGCDSWKGYNLHRKTIQRIYCNSQGCNYSTYITGNMSIHQHTHTGQTQYVCDLKRMYFVYTTE